MFELISWFMIEYYKRENHYGEAINQTLAALNAESQSRDCLLYTSNKRALHFYQRESFSIEKEQQDAASGEIEYVMKWVKKKL